MCPARCWSRGGLITRLADTSAQIRIRLTVLLVAGLALAAQMLGFEAILGAFLAGLLVRALGPSPELTHPLYPVKLEAVGYGLLVPVFFINSGLTLDLRGPAEHPSALAAVPAFLAALLVVRGLPALAFGSSLSRAELAGVALLQATLLPFLLAATEIGTTTGILDPVLAAGLVAAGLVSGLVFPAAALTLLARPAPSGAAPSGAAPSGAAPDPAAAVQPADSGQPPTADRPPAVSRSRTRLIGLPRSRPVDRRSRRNSCGNRGQTATIADHPPADDPLDGDCAAPVFARATSEAVESAVLHAGHEGDPLGRGEDQRCGIRLTAVANGHTAVDHSCHLYTLGRAVRAERATHPAQRILLHVASPEPHRKQDVTWR